MGNFEGTLLRIIASGDIVKMKEHRDAMWDSIETALHLGEDRTRYYNAIERIDAAIKEADDEA